MQVFTVLNSTCQYLLFKRLTERRFKKYLGILSMQKIDVDLESDGLFGRPVDEARGAVLTLHDTLCHSCENQ